jgi:hypothetical protein
MSVSEASAKVFEVLARDAYADAQKGSKYSEPYKGTFEEFLAYSYLDPYNGLDEVDLNDDSVWQEYHGFDSKEATYEGWTAKVVQSYGGEGEGDQYWMVVSISDGETTRYFRKDGWYASYDGGYLDGDIHEVQPKEKLVTFYE